MTRYVVIDTNVLVSAMLKENSVPGLVLKHVFSKNLIPVFNEEILDEYCEVLLRKKFHFPKEPFIVTPREMLDILEKKENIQRNF